MGNLIVHGGNRLFGELKIHGAKNSVLPILAATVLCNDECVIDNCPNISDVTVTVEILKSLGCTTELKNDSLYINSAGFSGNTISEELMRRLRSSVVFLGSILAKNGKAKCTVPGGCAIGKRPVDYHLNAFETMGAKAEFDGKYINVETIKLKDSIVMLKTPSVGATENAMLFASLGERKTVIINAAKEPEIVDLQNFLNKMGADVSGAGTPIITIYGAKKLHGAHHKIIPDRIEAATYMTAVAAVGGNVLLTDTDFVHMSHIADILSECGAKITHDTNGICIKSEQRLKSYPMIATNPYPGFPTDIQSVFMAGMVTADGTSIIVENIFENRFATASELMKMGADIKIHKKYATVCGKSHLKGAKITASDLRGGAALAVAALCAEGESIIENSQYIERGYENFEKSFRQIGADIIKVT